MAFRNEHHALRERVEALERELAETRAQLEDRSQDASFHEARAKQLERELEAARRELARHAPAPPKTSHGQRAWLTILVALGLVLVGAAVTYLEPRGTDVAPSSSPAADRAPEPSLQDPPVHPAPPLEPRAVVHAARVREVRAWPPLRPGDECRVESVISPRGEGLRVDRLAVRCGESTLYDSTAPPTGFVMSSRSSGALERPSPRESDEERFVYLLQYHDQGMRALPMAQIVLDTQRYQARVFRSPESEGEVVLDVDSWSAPVAGPPLLAATRELRYPFRTVVSRGLRLRSVQGAAPIERSSSLSCSLEIRPEPEGANFSCRILVRCGTRILYGANISGYNHCEIEGGAPVRAHDPVAYVDGDPELHLDLAEGTLFVRDDPPEGEWRATFSVEAPP